ncbi:MAG: UDP-2,3-diacylglucosamine diphosphatase [Methanotrichaceae archaeon]|nr:UDP-2,3-diacylglucosamine diphosphatase [Methanotrichaceae archaeon]
MIIVVSDVHLSERTDRQTQKDDAKFLEFLEYISSNQLKEGGELVLLGDIIDLWRRDFIKAMMDSEPVISKLMDMKNKINIHYLAGNHDFHMLNMGSILRDNYPFQVTKELRLVEGGKKFFFIHGYQLEVLANPYCKSISAYEAFSEGLCLSGDETGNAADKLWETYEASKSTFECLKRMPTDVKGALDSMFNPPAQRLVRARSLVDEIAISNARYLYLGMDKDETLIFGHTHEPFSQVENGAINTGSWNKKPCTEYKYVEISGGQVKPQSFL